MNTNKSNYAAVYVYGDQIPTIEVLVDRVLSVLNTSNGYYFSTEGASKEVKSFVETNFLEIAKKVQEKGYLI
jgi:hypothetical protein